MVNHWLAKCISVQRVKVTGNTVELHEQTTQMGLSYRWHSDCDDLSACCDHYVCTSGNAPSRNGHPTAPVIYHTPSEHSNSTNNVDNGNTADEEERVNTIRHRKHGIFQKHESKSFIAISKA